MEIQLSHSLLGESGSVALFFLLCYIITTQSLVSRMDRCAWICGPPGRGSPHGTKTWGVKQSPFGCSQKPSAASRLEVCMGFGERCLCVVCDCHVPDLG